MTKFPNSEKICRIKNPLDWSEEAADLMVAACLELAEFHASHNSSIGGLYQKHGFKPASLETLADLERIPSLGVQAMKYFLFTSLPENEAVLKLRSSGTRGQKTQVWFDQGSLDRAQSMLDGMWGQLGLVHGEPVNYLLFIYDPKDAKDLGIAFTVANQTRFAPAADIFYAIRMGQNGQWFIDWDGIMTKLKEYAASGNQLRIHGIPSFIFEFLDFLERHALSYDFQGGAMLTGGGWKAADDRKVEKPEFWQKVKKLLGIEPARIVDGYGMAEHSAPYMECPEHKFHVPAYCYLVIRNPETMAALPPGEVGLMELITPFNAMMPNLSILSTDLGMLDRSPCPCGFRSPTFTLIGRGGLKKHKGCAITASEIVKRSS